VAGVHGIHLYDDTYNANPGSVRAAIAFLESLPDERWLVLGDMAELGPDSPAMHREIGEAARRAGVARLYCTGPHSRVAAEAFGSNSYWHESTAELIGALQPNLQPGITVLVKGSRSMGMERVVQALSTDDRAGGH
jgi:UDP-N-acetylmuramoyl-tripeptide--D-alanyl-D-alanine ligase